MLPPARFHRQITKIRGFLIAMVLFGVDGEIPTSDPEQSVSRRPQTSVGLLFPGNLPYLGNLFIDLTPLPFDIAEIELACIHVDKPKAAQLKAVEGNQLGLVNLDFAKVKP